MRKSNGLRLVASSPEKADGGGSVPWPPPRKKLTKNQNAKQPTFASQGKGGRSEQEAAQTSRQILRSKTD